MWRRLSIAVALCGSACDTQVNRISDATDAPPSASCLAADDHSDLAWLQSEVFTPSCASFRACHLGRAASAGGLNLEDGNTFDNLIGVQSDLFEQYNLVAPGVPEESYLMIILGHYPGPIDPEVGKMPFNSRLLCAQKRNAIERWIRRLSPSGVDAGSLDASVGDGGQLDGSLLDAPPGDAAVTDAMTQDAPIGG